MAKKIAIIGAGIAGLSAGCYALMNGFEVSIFEMHNLPGGLCSAWRRKGKTSGDTFLFEGCLHYMVGFSPKCRFIEMWRELGVNRKAHFHEESVRFIDESGRELIMYCDADKLREHLLTLSPQDADRIKEFTEGIKTFAMYNPTIERPAEKVKFADIASMGFGGAIRFIRAYFKYKNTTYAEFASDFKDPLIRRALTEILGDESFPIIWMMIILSRLHTKDAAYPLGGSLEFARDLEHKFLQLGGKIEYKQRIEKVILEGEEAKGVLLAGGKEFRADYTISAADGYTTHKKFLDDKFLTPELEKFYEETPLYKPLVQVSLGVAADLSSKPYSYRLKVDRNLGKLEIKIINLRHYCFDKTHAPPGKSSLIATVETEFEFWEKLYQNKAEYRAAKEALAKLVIAEAEVIYPEIRGAIEAIDVATPMTYIRYTGGRKASPQGWAVTPKIFGKILDMRVKGLNNFYMCGHWLLPGGAIHRAAQSGRHAIQAICAREAIPFSANSNEQTQ